MKDELEVRLYGRHEDGGVESLTAYSAKYFDGMIPSPGDVIAVGQGSFGFRHYLVMRRYFVTHGHRDRGWALFVETIDEDRDSTVIAKQWAEDTAFAEGLAESADEERAKEESWPPVETAETLDRANRNPAYWTFERKEMLRKEREARVKYLQMAEEAAKKKD